MTDATLSRDPTGRVTASFGVRSDQTATLGRAATAHTEATLEFQAPGS